MINKLSTGHLACMALLFFLMSCDREKLDTKEFAKELKAKKIKRVTEGQISANVLKVGNLLSDTLDILFKQNKCDLQSLPVIQSFKEDFDVKVKVYSEKDTLAMDALTKQVVQSTLYGVQNHIAEASAPNVQYLRNEYWLYSKPLKAGQCGHNNTSILCVTISQVEIIKKLN